MNENVNTNVEETTATPEATTTETKPAVNNFYNSKKKKKKIYDNNVNIVSRQDSIEQYSIEVSGSESIPVPNQKEIKPGYKVRNAQGETVEKFYDSTDAIKYCNNYEGYKVVTNDDKLIHVSTFKPFSAHDVDLSVKKSKTRLVTPMMGVYLDGVYAYETSTSKSARKVLHGNYKVLDTNKQFGRYIIGEVVEDWKGRRVIPVGWVDAKYI